MPQSSRNVLPAAVGAGPVPREVHAEHTRRTPSAVAEPHAEGLAEAQRRREPQRRRVSLPCSHVTSGRSSARTVIQLQYRCLPTSEAGASRRARAVTRCCSNVPERVLRRDGPQRLALRPTATSEAVAGLRERTVRLTVVQPRDLDRRGQRPATSTPCALSLATRADAAGRAAPATPGGGRTTTASRADRTSSRDCGVLAPSDADEAGGRTGSRRPARGFTRELEARRRSFELLRRGRELLGGGGDLLGGGADVSCAEAETCSAAAEDCSARSVTSLMSFSRRWPRRRRSPRRRWRCGRAGAHVLDGRRRSARTPRASARRSPRPPPCADACRRRRCTTLWVSRLDLADQPGDLAGRGLGLLGQLADLLGHDGEALALLTGAGGLDRGVQRQQVRLLGQGGDRARRCRRSARTCEASSWIAPADLLGRLAHGACIALGGPRRRLRRRPAGDRARLRRRRRASRCAVRARLPGGRWRRPRRPRRGRARPRGPGSRRPARSRRWRAAISPTARPVSSGGGSRPSAARRSRRRGGRCRRRRRSRPRRFATMPCRAWPSASSLDARRDVPW